MNAKPIVKFVMFIIDWQRLPKLAKLLEREKASRWFTSKGLGTANSQVLDILGIGATEKAVVATLLPKRAVPDIFTKARTRLGRYGAGAGIAFSMPVSALSERLLTVLLPGEMEAAKAQTTEEESMAEKAIQKIGEALQKARDAVSDKFGGADDDKAPPIDNHLIISILNAGHSDAFMDAARGAGARGGTILGARGTAAKGALKFLGVTVQDEREIILIVAASAQKKEIMTALSKGFGLGTEAGGFIFSVPVDRLESLNA
jgi:nitrogen regulatory protein PII